MAEHTGIVGAQKVGARRPSRKSDGQDGPARMAPVPAVPLINTPGAPNAALKEAPPKPGEGVDPQHPCAAHLVVCDAETGVIGTPDGSPRRQKIAICGFASATRQYILAAAKDDSWEIWGLNQLYRHIPRGDVWFDVHYNWDQEVVPGTDHRQWAQRCGIPFYTLARQPDVPTNVRYPLGRVLAALEADYFTSTIPYMIALAILEIDAAVGPRLAAYVRRTPKRDLIGQDLRAVSRKLYGEYTIGIFGIDLVVASEYFCEKPCAEFWVGAAALGRGITMAIPPESALCKQLYRYGTDPNPAQLLKLTDLESQKAVATAKRDEELKQLYMLEGVIEGTERLRQILELRQRGASVE